MQFKLVQIEIENLKFKHHKNQTAIFFSTGRVGKKGFKIYSLYVDRLEGARFIKAIKLKPAKIEKISRKKDKVTVFVH